MVRDRRDLRRLLQTVAMGAAPDEVLSRFRAISALTSRFKEVK